MAKNKEQLENIDFIWVNDQKVNIVNKLSTEGACRNEDPEMFFPEGAEHVALTRSAKAICAECPVASLCLDYAVITKQWGIWGGTTMKERKLLKRESARDEYIRALRSTKGKRDIAKLEDENTIILD
jgi:WhiB family redox-sensing transcriptional regulator